jgi:hypothetical protein
MKATRYIVTLMIGFVATVHAESPLFSYQGRLLGSDGQPVNESVTMAINIHTSSTAGTAVYSESVGSTLVQNGIYSFSYGTNVAALRLALGTEESWLELVINSTPLSPRQRLHYTPYAVSLDENSLVQSTQFLLDMIAKHELEIQALRAQAGLINTSGGKQYFTETFPDADGLNNLVDINLTDAAYVPVKSAYAPGTDMMLRDNTQLTSSNCLYGDQSFIDVGGRRVYSAYCSVGVTGATNTLEGNVLVWWASHDPNGGATNFIRVECTNDMWQTLSLTTNDYPTGNVYFVSVQPVKGTNECDSPGRLLAKDIRLYLNISESEVSQLVMNIPTTTGRISHTALFANVDQNTNPDLIQFNLTDGSSTISNINLGQKYSLASLSNNPTKLYILLTPSPTNSAQDPVVESVMFKWWY